MAALGRGWKAIFRWDIALIFGYLAAIIAANLLVARFGPSVAVINAFVFIGLDLTTRDYLHQAWRGQRLILKMGVLIAAGSCLTVALNWGAWRIAGASFAAFALSAILDSLVYHRLIEKVQWLRINGSNIASAASDSIIFPILAFGWPPLWGIMLGQFLAKVAGGFLWSVVIFWFWGKRAWNRSFSG